jgi:predicted nuclease of predicted toxin-antitoxin system
MKLLLDQDIYLITIRFLSERGYDVITASQIGLSQASDDDLLIHAQEGGRIFLTRDRDFGNLVFAKAIGSGVIYLRMLPSTLDAVHNVLLTVLENHSEETLRNSFVVVEAKGYRIRKLKSR